MIYGSLRQIVELLDLGLRECALEDHDLIDLTIEVRNQRVTGIGDHSADREILLVYA